MTREERNRRINQIRGEVSEHDGQCESRSFGICDCLEPPVDWHLDSNWPTLLREMLCPYDVILESNGEANFLSLRDGQGMPIAVQEPNLEDAVCEAWLKWKSGQHD